MNDGKKKGAPKHQNKKAYKVTFQPHVDKIHQKVSLDGLCKRCVQQMQWKIQFNKYKKMTQPGKCSFCLQKVVFRSYMKACAPCTEQRKVCPKCLDEEFQKPQTIPQNPKQVEKKQKQLELEMMQITKRLKQRSRRTVKRGLQKGTISWSFEQKYFVDENGEKLTGLHFRRLGIDGQDQQKIDQLDEFGDQFGEQGLDDDLDDI